MSMLDTLRKTLTPDLFTQVTDALGDDFDFDLVPRSRLNTVIKQRNDLREQIGVGPQPTAKKTASKKASVESEDEDELDGQLDMTALRTQFEAEKQKEIAAVKIQYAALARLREEQAVDPDLIWSSNAFDKSKISIDETGKLLGFDEQLTSIKTARAKLFGAADEGVEKGTGKTGETDQFAGIATKADFLKLDTAKQLEFKQANPEVFKTFLNQ